MKIGNVRYRNHEFIARKINEEILLYSLSQERKPAPKNQNLTDSLLSDPEMLESLMGDQISPAFSLKNDSDLEDRPHMDHFSIFYHKELTITGLHSERLRRIGLAAHFPALFFYLSGTI